MSTEVALASDDTLLNFDVQPIPTAAESILQDLTPLLGPGSLLDENVKASVLDALERFVKVVELCCAGLHYTHVALTSLRNLLKVWDKAAPSERLNMFLRISKSLQYGILNVADAQLGYANLKSSVEAIFQKTLIDYGANVVVETESKRDFTGQLNVAKNTIQNMGNSIISHLEQSETTCSSCTVLLEKLKKLIHTFLEDESNSLALPLDDTPVWSGNSIEEWSALRSDFAKVDQRMFFITDTYKTWFKWNYDTVDEIMKADSKARETHIVLPDVKLQVPPVDAAKPVDKPPRVPYAIVSSEILHASSRGAASCVVSLYSLDLLTDGSTTMNLVCNISGHVGWSLRSMVLQCTFAEDSTSPVQIVDFRPKNSKEIVKDPQLEPKRCKPDLQVDTSSTSVKWVFTRSIVPWTTRTIPLVFSLSLDLNYKVEAIFGLQVNFIYRRRLFWEDVDIQHAVVNIPIGTTTGARVQV